MPAFLRCDDPHAPERATVVEHLARYRLGVMESFRQLPVFTQQSPSTIRKVLRMLQHESLIASNWLHTGRRYWHLTERGAAQCHLPPGRSGSLGEQAKLRAYAVLRFCCLTDRPRQRLTNDELGEHFPEVHRPGMPQGYYFDSYGTGRMGLLRIDVGLRGRWDRVVQSVCEDLREHLRRAGFRRLILAGRFEFTIATVLPQKAERIRESVTRVSVAHRTSIQVIAIPELLPLIASATGKEVRTT